MTRRSDISGFRSHSPSDRLAHLAEAAGLPAEALANLSDAPSLPVELADGMIENVVGTFELPLGVALNFQVNGKDYLVPMAVEEPSVVAAASYMAKIARASGGFQASTTNPVMRAQIQILGIADPRAAEHRLYAARQELIELANSKDHVLVGLGGGCKDIEVHQFPETPAGPMVVLHLLVDVRDAMGANTVNTMAELLAPRVAEIAQGKVRLRILSNLADQRIARARVRISPNQLTTEMAKGEEVIESMLEAAALAMVDPYRAATHNKGIMNGIDPVVLATGNDWRAIEAGAHAFAARSGRYTSLTDWEKDGSGHLCGTISLPMALGLVGGATKTHPAAQTALKLLDVASSNELAQVVAAVGLAQNMAALRALATEGIQKGHMALHARNIAITAGAKGGQIDVIAGRLVSEGEITVDRALHWLTATEDPH